MIHIQPAAQQPNESVRSWVYRSILEAIVNIDVEPTTMLDVGDLQAIFNASRTPIREAMIQLARDGFVKLLPQRGSYVSPIDLDEVEKARFMRLCLEKEILTQACDRCDDAAYRELRYVLECQRSAMEQSDNDCATGKMDGGIVRQLHQLDEKFHLVYYAVCKRDNIWDFLRSSNLHYLRFRILNIPMQGMKIFTYKHHEDLYEALVRRDRDAAVAVIENHLNTDKWTGKSLIEKTPEWFTYSGEKVVLEQV